MSTKIFVNLPVKDLNRSIEFFKKLGYQFNPQFTDETATCMIVSEEIYVMLLTHDKFKTFTPNQICDATKSTEDNQPELIISGWESRSVWKEEDSRLLQSPLISPSKADNLQEVVSCDFAKASGHYGFVVFRGIIGKMKT